MQIKQSGIVSRSQQSPSMLKLHMRTQPQFIKILQQLSIKYCTNNKDDLHQLKQMLINYLQYPSSDIAETHSLANRLGPKKLPTAVNLQQNSQDKNQQIKYCHCCGVMLQSQTLDISTSIQQIPYIGISVSLYFMTIKNLIKLLSAMFTIYSLKEKEDENSRRLRSEIQVLTSEKHKLIMEKQKLQQQKQKKLEKILEIKKNKQKKISQLQKHNKENTNSPSKQMIKLKNELKRLNLKMQQITKMKNLKIRKIKAEIDDVIKNKIQKKEQLRKGAYQNLQKQLQIQVSNYMKDNPQYSNFQIKICKINEAVPYYLHKSYLKSSYLKQIDQNLEECRSLLIDEIEKLKKEGIQQFLTNKSARYEIYRKIDNLKLQKQNQLQKLCRIMKKEKQQEHIGSNSNQYIENVPTFVTFASIQQKQMVLKSQYAFRKLLFPSQSFHYQLDSEKYTKYNFAANIKQAPEPQDIIWTNLGQQKLRLYAKKVLTFSCAVIILTISFICVYYLQVVDHRRKQMLKLINFENYGIVSTTIPSKIVSILIAGINFLAKNAFSYFTVLQRNQTYTRQQKSVAIKSILFSIVNNLVVPLLVCLISDNNFYGKNGLSDTIFLLAITNSFVDPILKIFNTSLLWLLVKRQWYSKPFNKLAFTQKQFNTQLYTRLNFQVGYEYIYPYNLFLFTCFYVSLEPIIPLITLLGFLLMYWVQKYNIFNYCRRPVQGSENVNDFLIKFIYFGPLFYIKGVYLWAHMLRDIPAGTVPNTIALIIAIIIAIIGLFPIKMILKLSFSSQQQKHGSYKENYFNIPSQYDRLNPDTSKQALQQYKYRYKYEKYPSLQKQQKEQASNAMGLSPNNSHKDQQQQCYDKVEQFKDQNKIKSIWNNYSTFLRSSCSDKN